jgi:hypothetical protein
MAVFNQFFCLMANQKNSNGFGTLIAQGSYRRGGYKCKAYLIILQVILFGGVKE